MTEFEFHYEHDGSLSRESMVMQALGAASMCWEHPERAGVFQDGRAKAIGEKLLAALDEPLRRASRRRDPAGRPALGLATTRQLLDEIAARIELDGANGGGGLDYRTAGEAQS